MIVGSALWPCDFSPIHGFTCARGHALRTRLGGGGTRHDGMDQDNLRSTPA